MWPWEHLAFGYLLFSVIGHLRPRFDPDDRAAVALLVFTQFPDLVDKPLAWVLGVFPSGQSVAHSVFVAVPVAAAALVVGGRSGRAVGGLAVAVGYLSHLIGDLAYPVLTGGRLRFDPVLWPVVVGWSDRQMTLAELLEAGARYGYAGVEFRPEDLYSSGVESVERGHGAR